MSLASLNAACKRLQSVSMRKTKSLMDLGGYVHGLTYDDTSRHNVSMELTGISAFFQPLHISYFQNMIQWDAKPKWKLKHWMTMKSFIDTHSLGVKFALWLKTTVLEQGRNEQIL